MTDDRARQALATVLQVGLIGPLIWAVGWSGASVWWWAACGAMCVVYSVYGVSLGMHRLFSHRQFRAARPVQIALALLGMQAACASPISWSIQHNTHHRHADTPLDPHAPDRLGWRVLFYWSHRNARPDLARSRHLLTDPFHRALHRHFWPVYAAGPALIFAAGLAFGAGVQALVFLWAIPVLYSQWALMASILNHAGGRARDSRLLDLLTLGEGRHLSHHENWQRLEPPLAWAAAPLRVQRPEPN